MKQWAFRISLLIILTAIIPANADIYPLLEQDPGSSSFLTNNVSNCSRGWRFVVNDSGVLVTQLGANSLVSSQVSQTITLFDFNTHAVLAQVKTTPGNGWVFVDLDTPVELTQGSEYIVSLYFGDAGGYYYGSRSSIGDSWFPTGTIEYIDMRYQNDYSASYFPDIFLNDYQYGLVDIGYEVATVPVPGAVLLGSIGLSCAGGMLRRRKK